MGYYRRIDVRMWGDETFRSLTPARPNAQTLFLWLILCPYGNALGLFEAGKLAMAEKLKWASKGYLEGYEKAFGELLAKGRIEYCPDHSMILIKRFLAHNPPANPNVLVGWRKPFSTLPECHLRSVWIDCLCTIAKEYKEGYREESREGYYKWFSEGLVKPFRLLLGYSPTPSPSPTTTPSPSETSCGESENPASPPAPDKSVSLTQLPDWFLTVLKSSPNFSPLLAPSYSAFWDCMIAAYDTYEWLAWDEQVTKADAWIEANPQRRPRQLTRFLHNWFEKAVEAGRKAPHATPATKPTAEPALDRP